MFSAFILVSCANKTNTPSGSDSYNIKNIRFSINSEWANDYWDSRLTYGLMINAPWEDGGEISLLFPEHLEYNPVGNTILRHYDSIPVPWIISPDRTQASYRVESPALDNVFVEAFARTISKDEFPFPVEGVKLAMKIANNGDITFPVIRPLLCMQYGGLKGFPQSNQENYQHNFIIMDDEIVALADLPTENENTTFKGCVVKGCPQHDTRAEQNGGLIQKEMDLALSVVTSTDNKRKVIIFWTPGKSMIANANIPCMHADPYFGTLKPGEEAYAEGYIIFTDQDVEPVIQNLKSRDKRMF
jgi:hypothetical protein